MINRKTDEFQPFELPLQPGTFEPTGITTIHCCLRAADARAMIEQLIAAMQDNWLSVCEEAGLATVERNRLWGRVLLNPYCLRDRESA